MKTEACRGTWSIVFDHDRLRNSLSGISPNMIECGSMIATAVLGCPLWDIWQKPRDEIFDDEIYLLFQQVERNLLNVKKYFKI